MYYIGSSVKLARPYQSNLIGWLNTNQSDLAEKSLVKSSYVKGVTEALVQHGVLDFMAKT